MGCRSDMPENVLVIIAPVEGTTTRFFIFNICSHLFQTFFETSVRTLSQTESQNIPSHQQTSVYTSVCYSLVLFASFTLREQIVISKLRVRHTNPTHSHLLSQKRSPSCMSFHYHPLHPCQVHRFPTSEHSIYPLLLINQNTLH